MKNVVFLASILLFAVSCKKNSNNTVPESAAVTIKFHNTVSTIIPMLRAIFIQSVY